MTSQPLQPPLLSDNALFLDIDGTLLDLAATPNAVIVPAYLPNLLRRRMAFHGGALALISGRSVADIDRLLGPGFAAAAEHGALLRDASGLILQSLTKSVSLSRLAAPLRAAISACPGALLEEKQFGLVLHWRGAPAASGRLTALAAELTAPYPELILQPAHEAMEIRQRGSGKADAITSFMRAPPFAGRVPVFVGDDLTDEPAISSVIEQGGRGLHVGRDFSGAPAAVLAWLQAGLEE